MTHKLFKHGSPLRKLLPSIVADAAGVSRKQVIGWHNGEPLPAALEQWFERVLRTKGRGSLDNELLKYASTVELPPNIKFFFAQIQKDGKEVVGGVRADCAATAAEIIMWQSGMFYDNPSEYREFEKRTTQTDVQSVHTEKDGNGKKVAEIFWVTNYLEEAPNGERSTFEAKVRVMHIPCVLPVKVA